MSNTTVEEIKNRAVIDASLVKYCRNCALSYFNPNEQWGYCKLQLEINQIQPLAVEEYYSCEHWKKK